MNGVIRSWRCQNARCEEEFQAWESHPECPVCHGVRVNWIPGGGHVAGTARAADAELRMLADNYGLSDLNSAARGERAKPKLALQPVVERSTPSISFAPGFTAPAHAGNQAMCVPSTSTVNFKTRVSTNNALAHSRSIPGVHAGTRIEAIHRPPK